MRSFDGVAPAVPVYVCAFAGLELATLLFGALPGVVGDCLLLFAMLNHYLLVHLSSAYRRTDANVPTRPVRALPVLALAPLLRVLSLAIPLQEVPQVYWYAFIGAPLLAAAVLTAHYLDLSFSSLRLTLPRWRPQIAIAASGLPLGLAAFFLAHPESLATSFQWRELIVGSVILVIFVGFAEEFVFRALLLQVLASSGGQPRIPRHLLGIPSSRMADAAHIGRFRKAVRLNRGLFWSSAVFAIMSIGSRSFLYVLFVGLVGMFFGWCVQRTGSIWGVVAAHSALVIGPLLIFPFVLR